MSSISGISTNITFTGLASGVDTSSLVEAILSRYQTNYDNEVKQQMLNELKLEKYKEVNALVLGFYDTALRDLRLESTFNQSNTTVTDSSVIDLISGGNDSDFIEILQTAKAATVSTESIANDVTIATTLGELGIKDDATINVNGTNFTLSADKTVQDFVSELNTLADVDVSWSESKQTFSIDFTGTLELTADTDVLESLGISTAGATYDNGNWVYSDQIQTSALTKNTELAGDTTLGMLGIEAGEMIINDVEIDYDETTTIDDMLQKFAAAGISADFEYGDDGTTGVFVFNDIGDGLTMSGDVSPFIDTSDLVADNNGEYVFATQETSFTTGSLTLAGTSEDTDGTDSLKLTDLGYGEGELLQMSTTDGNGFVELEVNENTTIETVVQLLQAAGYQEARFDSENMMFVLGDDIAEIEEIEGFEKLGINQDGTTTAIQMGDSTSLEALGITDGEITINDVTYELAGKTIEDVLNFFNSAIDGLSVSWNSENNSFTFDFSNVKENITIEGDSLEQLGFDSNVINIQNEISSVSHAVEEPTTSVNENTTLHELGYDISQGLSVNGTAIEISSSTTIDELVSSLTSAGVEVSFDNGTLKFELTGTDLTLGGDLETLGIDTSHNAIQNDDGTYTFTDEITADELERVTSAQFTTATKLSELGFSEEIITVNGQEINMNGNATIQDLLDNLNSKGINAAFDSTVGAFQFTSTSEDIVFGGDAETLSKLGIVANDDGEYIYEHQQAIATYNGMTVYSDTNLFELEDIIFSAKSEGTTSINVTPDIDSIYDSIETFVNSYNSLIEQLNTMLKADYNNSYMPLLDSEKAGMSDYEIQLWEDKIDSSLLSGDSTLSSLLSGMRTALQGYFSDASISTLSEIGITTSSNYSENGKLYIDEDILRSALTNDLDGVSTLLAGNEEQGVSGLIEDMYQHVNNMFRSTAGSSSMSIFNDKDLETAINNQSYEIDRVLARMEAQESIYMAKFLAMELTIQKLNLNANLFSDYTSSSWLWGS